MFLLGRQAMFGHDPPMYLRSITATRFPCWARVHAANFDPAPLPRTTRSYSSGSLFLNGRAEEMFSILCLMRVFPAQGDLNRPLPDPSRVTLSLHPVSANRLTQQRELSPSSGKPHCPASLESRQQMHSNSPA